MEKRTRSRGPWRDHERHRAGGNPISLTHHLRGATPVKEHRAPLHVPDLGSVLLHIIELADVPPFLPVVMILSGTLA
jgi:hypothetical protein